MSIILNCSGCGKQLRASSEHVGRQAQCPVCQAVTVVPEPGEEAEVVGVLVEPGPAITTAPRRQSTQKRQTCPECGEDLPGDAVLCIECGYDFRTGKRRRTVSKRLDRFWYSGLHLYSRLAVLGGVTVLLVPVCVVIMTKSLLIGGAILFFGAAYPLLLLGIYATIRLYRTREGRTVVAKTWHVLFVPITTTEVSLKRYQAVRIHHTPALDPLFRGITVILLLMGIIPGFLWFGLAFFLSGYNLRLRGMREGDELSIYRGWNADVVKDVADAFEDAGGLSIER